MQNRFTKKVLFVGIPDMAYVCLDGLLQSGVNIVGVIGPKKNHATFNDFKKFVDSKNLNFIEYEKLDEIGLIEKIKSLNPDIAVVCSFNYKIPKAMLESVKGGFINVHPSLLPKYRGPNPYSAAIIAGEKETGVTLHFMDENFDTGDIITQKSIPISSLETMGTLFNRTNFLAFTMLLDSLKMFETNPLPRKKQPEGNFTKSEKYGEKSFFINYQRPAVEIERFIRALNPFVVATTNFRGNLVKFFTAETFEGSSNQQVGTIVKIENDKFFIATKKGLLAPSVIQFGSFFVGNSKDFINILNPKIGECFL